MADASNQSHGGGATAPLGRSPRARLLEAAAELLVRDGMSVSLETIAQHAGVARMTLYRRLGRRDEIVLAVLTEQTSRLGRVITPILDDESRPFADRLVEVIVAVVMAVRASPVLTFFTRRVTPDEVVSLDHERSYLDGIWAYMQPWFDAAERRGELRHDATSTLDWTLRQTLLQLIVEGRDTLTEDGLRADLRRFFRPSIANDDPPPQGAGPPAGRGDRRRGAVAIS